MQQLIILVVLILAGNSCNAVGVNYFPGAGYGGEFGGHKFGGGGIGFGGGEGGHEGAGIGYGAAGFKQDIGGGFGYGHGIRDGVGITNGGHGGAGFGYGGAGLKQGFGEGIGYGHEIGGAGIGYGKGIGGGAGGYGIGGGIGGHGKSIGGGAGGSGGYGFGYGGGGKGIDIGYGGGAGGIGGGGLHTSGIEIGKSGGIGLGGEGIGHGGVGIGGGVSHGGFGAGGIGGGAGIGHGSAGISSGGYGGSGVGVRFIGGEEQDKSIYSGAKKNHADEHFEKNQGNKGAEIKHGEGGFTKGETAVKDVKGESAHFSDIDGGKKVAHDGKQYHGEEHFDKEGKHGGEKTVKQGHKKGHNIKGFKSSHHKDESGKTEEYYDEDHDEGGNYGFDGQFGKFGAGEASSFKGGHEDGKFNAEEAKKSGHFENEHLVDKAHANHGKFGENKYAGNEEIYGTNKGVDEHDLAGHQESSKYFKHFPIHY